LKVGNENVRVHASGLLVHEFHCRVLVDALAFGPVVGVFAEVAPMIVHWRYMMSRQFFMNHAWLRVALNLLKFAGVQLPLAMHQSAKFCHMIHCAFLAHAALVGVLKLGQQIH
jgi:hypothetical protein